MAQLTFPITQDGLVVDVLVNLDAATLLAIRGSGGSRPPLPARGLIDTASNVSGVSSAVLQQRAAPVVSQSTTTGIGGTVAVNLYRLSLHLWDQANPNLPWLSHPSLLAMDLPQGFPFDVLIGINLLREGLDLPEVALVAVLDADKEGFLRSHTSLIQTAGRAARHEKGRVIFYADVVTESIRRTLEVTKYRREKQIAYNREHGITPKGVKRGIQASLHDKESTRERDAAVIAEPGADEDVAPVIAQLETEMQEAAEALEFERAALLRDQINALRSGDFRKPKGTGGRAYQKGKHHRH